MKRGSLPLKFLLASKLEFHLKRPRLIKVFDGGDQDPQTVCQQVDLLEGHIISDKMGEIKRRQVLPKQPEGPDPGAPPVYGFISIRFHIR
jgi:hypothetical protein